AKCVECRLSKWKTERKQGKLQLWELTPTKFSIIHIDFTGRGMPRTEDGHTQVLVIVDRFSSWTTAIPVSNATAITVARALIERWFPYYGVPDTIITDRGSAFIGELMREFGKRYDIKVHHT